MRFTKYNRRKRKSKRYSQTEKDIMATKAMLIDKKLGYEVPISTYTK